MDLRPNGRAGDWISLALATFVSLEIQAGLPSRDAERVFVALGTETPTRKSCYFNNADERYCPLAEINHLQYRVGLSTAQPHVQVKYFVSVTGKRF
jgi:hypothetical protein